MTQSQYIQQQSPLTPEGGILVVIKLLSEDCTIPFIARYQKDQTDNLYWFVIR